MALDIRMEINIITVLTVLFCSALSGYFYWSGGEGGPWYRNTKVRDVGCAVISVALAWFLAGEADGSVVVSFFLLAGALTTYWKRGPDAEWYHWLFTGLGYGGSLLYFAASTGHFWGGLLYTVALGVLTSAWSVNISSVKAEAGGRGALICLLMPIMFLW